MSAGDRPDHDDPGERYDGTDPYDSESDNSFFPYAWPAWSGGWLPTWPSGYREEADRGNGTYDEDVAEEPHETPGAGGDEAGWLDEGLYTALMVVGVVLFVFPEPATSAIGVALVLGGALGWIADSLLG